MFYVCVVNYVFVFIFYFCISILNYMCSVAGMQTCQAYQSCPTCTHSWSPPLGPRRGCVYDGVRSFLPPDSPGREQRVEYAGHVYEYKNKCDRPEPKYRDSTFVQAVLSIATPRNPVLGHKVAPLISSWPGFDWSRVLCVPELMHDVKCLCDHFVRLLVGNVPQTSYKWTFDARHRKECKHFGVHEAVWPENGGNFPWRLTSRARKLLEGRMKRVMWPHYIEPLCYDGQSFWTSPGHMWKARRKYRLLLFILVTQLRDQIPTFRDALMLFVWALRRLVGQVCSYEFAVHTLGILPGSPFLYKKFLLKIHRDMARALSLLEGVMPIDYIKPIQHHFIHYPRQTIKFTLMEILWMMAFERYNKYLKEHVRNSQHPEINLANTTSQTDTANYFSLLGEEDQYDLPAELYHR